MGCALCCAGGGSVPRSAFLINRAVPLSATQPQKVRSRCGRSETFRTSEGKPLFQPDKTSRLVSLDAMASGAAFRRASIYVFAQKLFGQSHSFQQIFKSRIIAKC